MMGHQVLVLAAILAILTFPGANADETCTCTCDGIVFKTTWSNGTLCDGNCGTSGYASRYALCDAASSISTSCSGSPLPLAALIAIDTVGALVVIFVIVAIVACCCCGCCGTKRCCGDPQPNVIPGQNVEMVTVVSAPISQPAVEIVLDQHVAVIPNPAYAAASPPYNTAIQPEFQPVVNPFAEPRNNVF